MARGLVLLGSSSARVSIAPHPLKFKPRFVEKIWGGRKLQDVLYVSTYWGHERALNVSWLEPIAREMGALLSWDEQRIRREIDECLNQA